MKEAHSKQRSTRHNHNSQGLFNRLNMRWIKWDFGLQSDRKSENVASVPSQRHVLQHNIAHQTVALREQNCLRADGVHRYEAVEVVRCSCLIAANTINDVWFTFSLMQDLNKKQLSFITCVLIHVVHITFYSAWGIKKTRNFFYVISP